MPDIFDAGNVTIDNSLGGVIVGDDDGVTIEDIIGTVLVDNRFGGSIIGVTGDGADIETVTGNVTVDNSFGGFISGADDGVDIDNVIGKRAGR